MLKVKRPCKKKKAKKEKFEALDIEELMQFSLFKLLISGLKMLLVRQHGISHQQYYTCKSFSFPQKFRLP